MKIDLTPEQRQMIATVRELTQERFVPRGLRWMDGTFPWENLRELAEMRACWAWRCPRNTAGWACR